MLFSFCDKARPMDNEPGSAVLASTEPHGRYETHGNDAHQKEGTILEKTADLPSLCSTMSTHSSPSIDSSTDRGSESIIDEPDIDRSSLSAEQPRYIQEVAALHNMAGLPLFKSTFRQWMSGGSATAFSKHIGTGSDDRDSIDRTGSMKAVRRYQPRLMASRIDICHCRFNLHQSV